MKRAHLRVVHSAPKADVKRKRTDPALENVKPSERGSVVSVARSRSKARREPTERQVRHLRFLWMRPGLTYADLPALNWIDTGGLFCRGLLVVHHLSGKLIITAEAKRILGPQYK